jgi:hypothetical protein
LTSNTCAIHRGDDVVSPPERLEEHTALRGAPISIEFGERLFTEDVLARTRRRDDDLGVESVGYADVHGVDLRIVEEVR